MDNKIKFLRQCDIFRSAIEEHSDKVEYCTIVNKVSSKVNKLIHHTSHIRDF